MGRLEGFRLSFVCVVVLFCLWNAFVVFLGCLMFPALLVGYVACFGLGFWFLVCLLIALTLPWVGYYER